MRKAINPGRSEKNVRIGYVYIAFTMLAILAIMNIISPISAKAEESFSTYNVGEEVVLNSDYWNVRKGPSVYSELDHCMEDETVFVILEVRSDYWYKIKEKNTNYEEAYIQISPFNSQYFAKWSDNEQITTTIPETTTTTDTEMTTTITETTTTTTEIAEIITTENTTTVEMTATTVTTNTTEERMTTTGITTTIINNEVPIGALLKFNGPKFILYDAPYSDFRIGEMEAGEELIVLTDFAAPCYGVVTKSMPRVVWIVINNDSYHKYFTPVDISTLFTTTTESTTTPTTTTTATATTTETSTIINTTTTTIEDSTRYKVGDRIKLLSYNWNIRKSPTINSEVVYQMKENEEFKIIENESNYWYKIGESNYIQIVPECRQYFVLLKDESLLTTVTNESTFITSTATTATTVTTTDINTTTIPTTTIVVTMMPTTTVTTFTAMTTTTMTTTTIPINSEETGKRVKFNAQSWYVYDNKYDEIGSDTLYCNEEFLIIDDTSAPWLFIKRADGSNVWILLNNNNYQKYFSKIGG